MSDKIGVLGSAVATAVATATVYTCPANKAAKFKVFFRLTGGVNSNIDIVVNGITVASSGAMTSGHFWFSQGVADSIAPAPGATAPTGVAAGTTVSPSGATFFLSAGQTLQYTVSTAALGACNMQAVGTEVDV